MSEREGPSMSELGISPREELLLGTRRLIEEERFILDPEKEEELERQVRERERYICMVIPRVEGDRQVERFLKIPVNDNPEIDEPFRRQIEYSKFLKGDGRIKTRGVLAANVDRERGTPYAIMETFPEGEAKIGFISSHEDMELLSAKEAKSCVENLMALQGIDVSSLPPEFYEVLQKMEENYAGLEDGVKDVLKEKVKPLDGSSEKGEPYHQVLNRRLKVKDFRKKALELVKHWKTVIEAEDDGEEVLVHGDLAPNNLYVYDDGNVEFLDLEWGGVCDNKAIAAIIDFGNLRARAWNNKEFRDALDEAMIEAYESRGQKELGRAIVSLGILRSHMSLAGCFENYDLEKQRREEEQRRRESTEEDIVKAWEVAGLDFYKKKK